MAGVGGMFALRMRKVGRVGGGRLVGLSLGEWESVSLCGLSIMCKLVHLGIMAVYVSVFVCSVMGLVMGVHL